MRETSGQLTPQQVALYCGVSTQTVDDWLNKGRLHAMNQDGERTVDASELIHFMDQNHLAIPPDLTQPAFPARQIPDVDTHAAPPGVIIPAIPDVPFAVVVDSDTSTSHTIETVLKDLGLSCVRVAAADDAWGYLEAANPMLVTMELDGGDRRSLQLIEQIRRDGTSLTRVLVVSNQMPSALIRAKSAGADAIVTKPFDNDTLKRTVKILLNINT